MKYTIDQNLLYSLIKDFFINYQKESGISTIIRKKKNSRGIWVYFKNIRSICIYFDHQIQCNVLIYDHKYLSKSKSCDFIAVFDTYTYLNNNKFYDPFLLETDKYDSVEELLHINMFYPLDLWLLDNIKPTSRGLIKKIYINNEYSHYRGTIINNIFFFKT